MIRGRPSDTRDPNFCVLMLSLPRAVHRVRVDASARREQRALVERSGTVHRLQAGAVRIGAKRAGGAVCAGGG